MLTSQDLPSPAMRPPAESKRRGQFNSPCPCPQISHTSHRTMPPCLSRRVRVHLSHIRQPAVRPHPLTSPNQTLNFLLHTFRLPPGVSVMLTKRRVYSSRLWARPLGVLGFSWTSTCAGGGLLVFRSRRMGLSCSRSGVGNRGCGIAVLYLGGLRLDLACARDC